MLDRVRYYQFAFPVLSAKNAWITGVGFIRGDFLNAVMKMEACDNFYLFTIIQSGIIGAVLLIGSILWAVFLYFQNVRTMSKLQRLTGAFIIIFLLGGFLDCRTFGHGAIYYMIYWMLFVVHMNERTAEHKEAV